MRVFFYGIGRFYQRRREELMAFRKNDSFLGFIDKRATECRVFDGERVYLPEEAAQVDFDAIVVTNASFSEVKSELCQRGVNEVKVLSYGEYLVMKMGNVRREYGNFGKLTGKKLFFATPALTYRGDALALLHAAIAMQRQGHCVSLAAPMVDKRLVQEMAVYPIRLIEIPALRYLPNEQLTFLQDYDAIIVNDFWMVHFAIQAVHWKPILWWVHENSTDYSGILKTFPKAKNMNLFDTLRIAAVSVRARNNFEKYYPGRIDTIIPFCEADNGYKINNKPHKNVIFSLIGLVLHRKAQDIFLQAIAMLPKNLKERAEFQIIGKFGEDDFSKKIFFAAKRETSVRLLGVLNRAEMREAFRSIDVVVCASREETMSLTITEGMMYGKICITTDATGMADYIENGKNGFVVPTEDPAALAACMVRVIEQPEQYAEMRNAARRTYEAYFMPEHFARNLISELSKTVETWKEEHESGR